MNDQEIKELLEMARDARVQKIDLGPSDTLVFMIDAAPSQGQVEFIRSSLSEAFPDRKIALLTHGMKLAVLHDSGVAA